MPYTKKGIDFSGALSLSLFFFNMLCIWNPFRSKYIKHHFNFFFFLAMEKKILQNLFNFFYFRSIFLYFFFFLLHMKFKMLECKKGVKRRMGIKEHTTEQTNIITLHYCIQYGSRKQRNPKRTLICTTLCDTSLVRHSNRFLPLPPKQPLYGLLSVQCHTIVIFFWNIQIICTILSCQIKKIYCGSLLCLYACLCVCFFHYQKKKVHRYLFCKRNKQQLKIQASL